MVINKNTIMSGDYEYYSAYEYVDEDETVSASSSTSSTFNVDEVETESPQEKGVCGSPIIFNVKCNQPSDVPGTCLFHTAFVLDMSKKWGRCGSITLRTGQLCLKIARPGVCRHHRNFKPKGPVSNKSRGFVLGWENGDYILKRPRKGLCTYNLKNGERCSKSIYKHSENFCFIHCKKRKAGSLEQIETVQLKRSKGIIPKKYSPTSSSSTLLVEKNESSSDGDDDELGLLDTIKKKLKTYSDKMSSLKADAEFNERQVSSLKQRLKNSDDRVERYKAALKQTKKALMISRPTQTPPDPRIKNMENEIQRLKVLNDKYRTITDMISKTL